MTLITTDSQHYADIASAIRSKAGVQDLFKPSQMAPAIAAIPTGGGASLGSKTITDNGTYYASADSLDGYSQVTVNVQGGGGADIAGFIEKTAATINDSVASFVASSAFYNFKSLTSVQLDGVLRVSDYGFDGCNNLSYVSMPLCETVGYGAFMNCSKLEAIDLPACTSIVNAVFTNCVELLTASLPSCSVLGSSAFTRDSKLKSVYLPTCQSIYAYAFSSCIKLESINLPQCTLIGSYAFFDCWSLSIVNVPLCEILSINAFARCSTLSEISIPACKSFSQAVFMGCYMLTSVNLTGVSSVPSLYGSDVFNSTPIGGYSASAGQYGSIYVPASLYADFISHSKWSWFSDRIVSV